MTANSSPASDQPLEPESTPSSLVNRPLKTATAQPTQKVMFATTGAAVGSSIGILAGIIITAFLVPSLNKMGIQISEMNSNRIEEAITVIFTATSTFVLGYKARPGLQDAVVTDQTRS